LAGSLAGAPPALPRSPLNRCAGYTASPERTGDAHRAPFPTGGYTPPCKDTHALPATRRAPASFLLSQGLPGRLLIDTKLDTDQTLIATAGLEQWCQACLCRGYCPTSAKVPRGIEALRAAMAQATPLSTHPRSYQRAAATWRCSAALCCSISNWQSRYAHQSQTSATPAQSTPWSSSCSAMCTAFVR
jgi:hypothetical protein